MRLNGIAMASVGVGVLFVYSGVRGFSVLKAAQNVVKGQPVTLGQSTTPLDIPAVSVNNTTGPSPTTTTNNIANDALRYAGHAYLYGGAPGTDGKKPWDCSSFVNWVLGHDLGFTLPNSTVPGYSGLSHGPTTLSYLAWGGARTVGHTQGIAQAGDIVVGVTHMGIATGGGQYISAHDPAEGTSVKPISSFPDVVFSVRRVVIGNPDA